MPGPQPFARPVFPVPFLEHARVQSRRKTIAYQERQRCQLVLLLDQQPDLDNEEVGRRVGLSGRQVRRWRQRWDAGDFSVADFPRCGRPRVFSPLG
jgi:Homeodomain-like domain